MTSQRPTLEALRGIVGAPPGPSSEGARRVMVGNRRRDSRPELELRRALHRAGLRYRVDMPVRVPDRRPIRPDIVFTRARVAVFIDGCFWHGCPEHGTRPKANSAYWSAKVALNQRRDRDQSSALLAAGWSVVRIWEHEDPVDAAARIGRLVTDQAAASSGSSTSAGSNADATA